MIAWGCCGVLRRACVVISIFNGRGGVWGGGGGELHEYTGSCSISENCMIIAIETVNKNVLKTVLLQCRKI